MADTLSPENAQYVLAVLEVFLWGISVLGFMITLWTLLRGKLWSQIDKLVLLFAVFLFTFQTMYTVVGIRRRYYGFVTLSGSSYPGGPSTFFENVTTTAVLLRNISWDLQVALGDAIVIWRAYVVWQTPWIVVPPIVIWVGFIVAAIGELLSMRNAVPSVDGLFSSSIQAWSTATLALTMSCNLLSTCLLAYRLWKLEQKLHLVRSNTLRPHLIVILDTGLLYSVWVFVAFITDVLGSRFEYVFDNSLPSIISIAFFTLLLRFARIKSLRARDSRDSFDMHSLPVQVGIDYLNDRTCAENSTTDTQTKLA
ncbi:hypothetical protein IW261DRAFT_1556366 [Armillaria novae-zelandiae]|uniref:Uncharacterized protein n=1 Tax=Armillaria novae-zelandiae TaxID=153914 RepID=A0AA39TIZ5_9AGAR|nr:hypothetical protein IW261DRAFT_1556366 [Armillaria novae-zelandiae]